MQQKAGSIVVLRLPSAGCNSARIDLRWRLPGYWAGLIRACESMRRRCVMCIAIHASNA